MLECRDGTRPGREVRIIPIDDDRLLLPGTVPQEKSCGRRLAPTVVFCRIVDRHVRISTGRGAETPGAGRRATIGGVVEGCGEFIALGTVISAVPHNRK